MNLRKSGLVCSALVLSAISLPNLVADASVSVQGTATCVPQVTTSAEVVPSLSGQPISTSVAGNAVIRTLGPGITETLPPPNWSPLTATSDELQYYGFPARPVADTAAYSQWLDDWKNYSGMVAMSACLDPHTDYDTSGGTWAGIVDVSPSVGYTQAYARFPQPIIDSGCSSTQNFDSWVGLGGLGGSYGKGLIQNGTTDLGQSRPADRGPDHNVAIWTVTVDPTGHSPGTDWYGPGFISRGDFMSISTTYLPSNDPGQTYVEYYWHDGTTGHVAIFKQYSMETFGGGSASISYAYNGTSADYVNEVVLDNPMRDPSHFDTSPFEDQVWSSATSTDGGATAAVGTRSHLDYYALGSTYFLKTIGLSPPYLQTNSSWTEHHFRCN